jgi:hypothetical protein
MWLNEYVNFTNGISCMHTETYHLRSGVIAGYCRIQSSHCESKAWDRLLWAVPDDMLARMSLGQHVVVHDVSEKDREPRSMWQGLELIRYVAEVEWLGTANPVTGRGGTSMEFYFGHVYRNLHRSTRRRFRYYRDYASALRGGVRLRSCWRDDRNPFKGLSATAVRSGTTQKGETQ